MALLDFFGFRTWFLQNTETRQVLRGQFEPIDATENINNNYAKNTVLNRKNPIVQFLSGQAKTITFGVRLFARDILFSSVEDDLNKLKEWSDYGLYGHPPVLSFWVGDGHIEMASCVIESLSGIRYGRPTALGAVKDVSLTVNLLQYEPYYLVDVSAGETRYHRAKVREYYEILTYREYGNALIGDVIRKRHPSKPNLKVADIVKLPSIEVIRKDIVEPKSDILKTAYGRKDTAQRRLRLEVFDRTDITRVSHIVKA